MNQLLLMLKESYGIIERPRINNESAIVSILNYVDRSYKDNITIKMIADSLGYTKEYCSQVFNRYMGESFRKYLNRIRIYKFQDLFRDNGNTMSIIEIAKLCGFDSQATFYRAYRDVYGTTPKCKKM